MGRLPCGHAVRQRQWRWLRYALPLLPLSAPQLDSGWAELFGLDSGFTQRRVTREAVRPGSSSLLTDLSAYNSAAATGFQLAVHCNPSCVTIAAAATSRGACCTHLSGAAGGSCSFLGAPVCPCRSHRSALLSPHAVALSFRSLVWSGHDPCAATRHRRDDRPSLAHRLKAVALSGRQAIVAPHRLHKSSSWRPLRRFLSTFSRRVGWSTTTDDARRARFVRVFAGCTRLTARNAARESESNDRFDDEATCGGGGWRKKRRVRRPSPPPTSFLMVRPHSSFRSAATHPFVHPTSARSALSPFSSADSRLLRS